MRRGFFRHGGVIAALSLCATTSLYAEELPPRPQTHDQQPKVQATQPIGPSAKAVEALHQLDSSDDYQRELGFLRLEALREPGTAAIIAGYVHHKNPDTRAYSLRALSAIQGPAAVSTLIEALRSDRQPRVRRAALLGLETLVPSDPRILPALIKALKDRNAEVRMTAVDVVSRVDDPRAREAILFRNKRESQKDVRRVLDMAMKRLKTS